MNAGKRPDKHFRGPSPVLNNKVFQASIAARQGMDIASKRLQRRQKLPDGGLLSALDRRGQRDSSPFQLGSSSYPTRRRPRAGIVRRSPYCTGSEPVGS